MYHNVTSNKIVHQDFSSERTAGNLVAGMEFHFILQLFFHSDGSEESVYGCDVCVRVFVAVLCVCVFPSLPLVKLLTVLLLPSSHDAPGKQ